MLTDIHCHPYDLNGIYPEAEQERKRLGVLAASSACGIEEFTYNEQLSHNAIKDSAPPFLPCFGIHPQIFKIRNEEFSMSNEQLTISNEQRIKSSIAMCNNLLEFLFSLASEKRLSAIGECGFDLYDSGFKETEELQDYVFTAQIETAIRFELPLVLHVRRAMHKIFAVTNILTKCKAVIFHSWSGTFDEAKTLLQRGVNVYFSFGNTIKLNHKQAMKSCALLPAERLLTETDAPYQPRRGEKYSSWADLPLILEAAVALRNEAGNKTNAKELENQIESNFNRIF